jgi:hypothetical protein
MFRRVTFKIQFKFPAKSSLEYLAGIDIAAGREKHCVGIRMVSFGHHHPSVFQRHTSKVGDHDQTESRYRR